MLLTLPRSFALVLAFAAGPIIAQEVPPTAVSEPAGDEAAAGADDAAAKAAKDRRGIPVEDPVVHTHCARCHALDDRQHMTRISYLRKSPEGWAESTKRMIRLHGLQLSPADAKAVVRSLANSHGLARSEAERGLYESERRVHWSEEQQDQDFRRACSVCHPLGRVLLQQRDAEEWQLLRATHVAMFPLSRGQMGGGPPEESSRRQGPPPPTTTPASARGGARGGASTETPRGGASSETPDRGSRENVGDRVLQRLATDQPLFTPAWESWTRNRRAVPLAGTWTVTGHEVGRGDLFGTAVITSTGDDDYDVQWTLAFADGTRITRNGKGLLYAGYSWRGRSQSSDDADTAQWREVLLLDDSWNSLRGRTFTGLHDEVGADLSLHRQLGRPRVLGLGNRAVPVPTSGHRLEVYGEAFPADLSATSFFVGQGVTITAVERLSATMAQLTIDVAAGTELGARIVAFGSEPGSAELLLYDTVDYIRVTPLQGLARVGGVQLPAQIERFEAIAMHRGVDKKPYTNDDVDLFQVRPRWALEEFQTRESDDDIRYVGTIDPDTGVFAPAIDGPNPARKWSANNVGDVFVTAEVELEVAVRPPEPKPADAEADKGEDKPKDAAAAGQPDQKAEVAAADTPTAPTRERRTFRARSHLIVTVPLFVKWAALDWEDR